MRLIVHSTVLSIVIRTLGVFFFLIQEQLLQVEQQAEGIIASLSPNSIACEDGPLWKKADCTWEQMERLSRSRISPSLPDARPWEEGGKRRIVLAKLEGENGLF
jgi:hypothetical protein